MTEINVTSNNQTGGVTAGKIDIREAAPKVSSRWQKAGILAGIAAALIALATLVLGLST